MYKKYIWEIQSIYKKYNFIYLIFINSHKFKTKIFLENINHLLRLKNLNFTLQNYK